MFLKKIKNYELYFKATELEFVVNYYMYMYWYWCVACLLKNKLSVFLKKNFIYLSVL